MSQSILGIDLGTYSVKVLRLERHMQELHLVEFFELPLSVQSSRQHHDEQVKEVLTQFFTEHKFKTDVVCMTLPGHLLSTRVLELPFTNVKRIGQVIEFELEGYIPFHIEDIFWDYHILSNEGNKSCVLCTYTYESNVQKYLDCLSGLYMDAKFFGADFSDFASIAQISMLPTEGYYALCDIGHSKTNVLIMEGKELRYARTIGIGGFHFTRAIQRVFNLNYEKAEALKLSRGKLYVREQDSDQVSRILSRVAKELVSAIKQTFMGAAKHNKNLTIPAIYCSGGGTKLIGILEHLSFQLRTNVFELDTLAFTNHHFDDPEEVNRIIPQVLSTAIRPIYYHRVPKINFRKGPYAFKQDLQVITKEFKSVSVFLALIFILGLVYYFYAEQHYAGKIVTINKKMEELIKADFTELKVAASAKRKNDQGSKLNGYLKSVDSKIKEYEENLLQGDSGENILQVMYEISRKLPPKQQVNFETTEFQFNEHNVVLKAKTNDTLNVEKIIEALKKSEMFSEVTSTDAQPKPGGVWDFQLKIDIKKVAELSE